MQNAKSLVATFQLLQCEVRPCCSQTAALIQLLAVIARDKGVKIEPLMSRQDRLQLLQQSGPHLQQHAALCSKCAELACGDTRASNEHLKRLKFYKLASQYYVYLS